jgi:anhydro-N-acetylmuramic acid kinase
MALEKEYKVIGLMSGTSLDGLDIAFCNFNKAGKKWFYKIVHAETIEYNDYWKETLKNIENEDAFSFAKTNKDYGHFLGQQVKRFITKHHLNIDFIASHGHTIFHQPNKKITFQIGDGAAIASETGVPVVCDFRSLDVALNGQGAPLVPIGDKILFSDYQYCLNLGGFANISFEKNNERIAFDICPANIVLNFLSDQAGYLFDDKGKIAASGKVNQALLSALNKLKYYKKKPPKSLGKEWVISEILPLLITDTISISDKLRTFCEHIADQITKVLPPNNPAKVLVTGGGTHNDFLIRLLKQKSQKEIILPDKKTIDYKEALIFAFLGVLRMRNEINCLKSVTGASKDNIGGAVYVG